MQTELDFVTNRDLFSNYYLKEHLPETDDWEVEDEDELRNAFDKIRGLYEDEEGSVENYNESQLEKNFIRPVFEALGHVYEVEETVERGRRRPDYALFKAEDLRQQAIEGKEEDKDFYRNALSVADAKQWDLSLDKLSSSGEKKRDFSNPSHQIHVYLQETPVDWAVLTNGKHWRIYYSGTSHKLDSYYDVDLEALLEDESLEEFKYFYQFFRNGAFVEDTTGDCFLDDVYEGSNTYSQELGDDLQDNIYEAIKLLAEGFLKFPENDLEPDEELDLIHDASLTYLYRLIFVLYAESEGRDLLETRNEIYDDSYSLNSLKREVVEELGSGDAKYTNWQDDLWDRLSELFELIDQGSKSRGIPEDDLYIPAYNGGLFKTEVDEDTDEQSRFLQENKVGDAYIAEVVELLTRSEAQNGKGRVFVDYSSLDIRHLGSIYEGLLEYELNVAPEPMVAVKDDGEEWMTEDEFEDEGYDDDDVVERLEAGDVYLTTDRGERKATGSYYTPEYVVQYIVENTLDPILDDIRADVIGQTTHSQDNFAEDFAERVFDLKILDPAMGSGHFLTNAVDHLAREIVNAQELQADEAGIETVDESHDIHWARRQVAQKCIYGVDLNDMAVELAKVSLWLRTLAAEQPLAFLDHHLKTGNSLVGSNIEEIDALERGTASEDNGANSTLTDFGLTFEGTMEDLMSIQQDIIAIENEELDDIKEMEKRYGEFEKNELRRRLEAIADVRTAEEFGVEVPSGAYERMARALKEEEEWREVETTEWFAEAQKLAGEQSFFHWRLEYPEAFYDESGDEREDAGFNAVIGNPPYVKVQTVGDETKDYLRQGYESAHKRFDLYMPFIERAASLTGKGGRFSYIAPSKFTETESGMPLRQLFSEKYRIDRYLDFTYQVFPEVTTYTCVFVAVNQRPEQDSVLNYRQVAESDGIIEDSYTEIEYSNMSEDTWSLSKYSGELYHVSDRLKSSDEFIDAQDAFEHISKGIDPGGSTEIFVITKEEAKSKGLEKELVEPVIPGDDIDRWQIDSDKVIIFPYTQEGDEYQVIPEPELEGTEVYSYLNNHRQTLSSREYVIDAGKEWYELWNQRQPETQDTEKLVICNMSKRNRFAYDDEDRKTLHTTYSLIPDEALPYKNLYLLSLMNSKLLTAIFSIQSTEVRGGYYRYNRMYLKDLPIREIDFTTPDSERSSRVSSLLDDYEEYLSDDAPAPHPDEDDIAHDFLAELAERMTEYKEEHVALNLSLLDYLGISTDDGLDGDTLGDLYMPPAGLADSTVAKTAEELEGLRVEGVGFEEDGTRLVMSVGISYKPDEDDPRETDRWGRLAEEEFETYEAMVFTGLSDEKETLVRNFVPVAVDEAGGFAGFRQSATQTIRLIDRLEDLTLPDVGATRDGLERYIDVKERADELDEKIEKTDALIDEIVYDLYGLTDEEIEIVEDSVQD
jgi:type II restriction/modification system DNA methylase subunit YeeA